MGICQLFIYVDNILMCTAWTYCYYLLGTRGNTTMSILSGHLCHETNFKDHLINRSGGLREIKYYQIVPLESSNRHIRYFHCKQMWP